jgi:hypothetical protein
MQAVRWSGESDRYWGPFTYARERRAGGRTFGIILTSGRAGDEDDYANGCYLRMHLLGHTLIVALPPIIKPAREWHEITTEPTRTQMIEQGRKPGYWEVWARDYGFCFTERALHYDYGRQTHSSDTDQSGCWFLPWLGHRHIRRSFYDREGIHFYTLPDRGGWREYNRRFGEGSWRNTWDAERAIEEACPTVRFAFDDYDGERIEATTKIEEREWAHGTGWFRWLSLFRRNMVRRSLDMNFSKETGRRKGSWKGGTVGTGIEMRAGELHEAAFRRYCAQNNMTFIGGVE